MMPWRLQIAASPRIERLKAHSHCIFFMVTRQFETAQWSTLKYLEKHETELRNTLKHHEIPWNTLNKKLVYENSLIWLVISIAVMISMWLLLLIHDVSLPCKSMFHELKTHCFILILPDSRCFTTIKQNVSSWIDMFHGVSRPSNKLFHCWFMLIQPVSSLFHNCLTSLNALVSSWFNQFHHRFTTVSPVGTSLNSATWDRVLRYNNVRQTPSILYSVSILVTLCYCYHINYLQADRPISPWAGKPIFQLYGRIFTIRDR